MKKYLFFAYGLFGHVLFLAVFAYLLGFVGGFFVPKTIDSAPAEDPATDLVVNLALLSAFAAQHSIMARPAFKKLWTRIVPPAIERSTYVYASCAVTILLMWQWRGMSTPVWEVTTPALRTALWGLFAAGWLLVPAVTLLINHFDLFGTRQVWLHLRGQAYRPLAFRTPLLYKHVRHPLYLGWTIAFWATPTMTTGHLLFAVFMTTYMAGAAFLEERDLVSHFGKAYADYQQRVPMFLPKLLPDTSPTPAGDQTVHQRWTKAVEPHE